MKHQIIIILFFFLPGIFLTGCMPYEEEVLSDVHIDLKDTLFQRIYSFQQRQESDSLLSYFAHRDPTYRYLAAQAFASIKDPAVIDTLATLLNDPVEEVRAAAAYAMGQTGAAAAEPLLVAAFARYDTVGQYRKANRAILEAIGKVGDADMLQALATISTYRKADTALLEGQAWGLYRFALRKLVTPEGTDRMLAIVNDPMYPSSVRFIAANYLHRAADIQIDSLATGKLAGLLPAEPDHRLRMTLATALGKARTKPALATLLTLYQTEQDYRVKCNILRAFRYFDYAEVQGTVLEALHDPNTHLAVCAAQFFLDHGIPEDATLYWRLTRDSITWQAQIPMFAAALRHLPSYYGEYRDALNYQLRQRFREAESPFVQVAVLEALTEFPWNLRYIFREGFSAETPMVRAAAVNALAIISRNSRNLPGVNTSSFTQELSSYFQEAIRSGDPGMMAPAAEALAYPDRNYRATLDSLAFLERVLGQIDSATDYFTYRSLRQALDFFNGEAEGITPASMPIQPVDWKSLNAYSVEPEALIRTGRGVIQIKLLPKTAPESVANFIRLANSGYYRGKYFYRVVPNFVIQGAESTGYDPVGFTIRSELPHVSYDVEGLLGMASAGNHTESTQFFITHSPTPHLDGNYTLFGRVVVGMDVVQQIQIGDQIQDIVIQ